MPKPVDILWCVEHVARELDVACAVAAILRSRGVDVAIESLVFNRDELTRRYRPRIVAVPYFYSAGDLGVHDLCLAMPSSRFVNLAFEQLFSKGNMRFKRPRDVSAQEHVMHLSSGSDFSDFLTASGVCARHQGVTGSLPMGLYRHPYQNYFAGYRTRFAKKFGLDNDLPWIFFPENFGAAFFSDRELQVRVDLGCDADEVRTYRSHSQKSLAETMRWCAHLARSGTAEVIVRPRPAISTDNFKKAVRGVLGTLPKANLHFIKDSTVRHWVLAAETTVSTFSSTVVEAAVAGRPASLLAPEPLPESMHCSWHDHADQIADQEAFMELPSRCWQAERDGPLADWTARQLLSTGDPIEATAHAFTSILQGQQRAPTLPNSPLGKRVRGLAKLRWRGFVRRNLARCGVVQQKTTHHNDLFTQSQVQQRIDRWAQLLAPSERHSAA